MSEKRERKFWLMRTAREQRNLIFAELKACRLRQGWGYDECQDLNKIFNKLISGTCYVDLSKEEKQAWAHGRMLEREDDSFQIDDVVLVPQMPVVGKFSLVRIVGPYRFEMIENMIKTYNHFLDEDFGHILPIELLTPDGIDNGHHWVGAALRSSMKTRSRWCHLYSEAASDIERILGEIREHGSVLASQDRLLFTLETWREEAKKNLYDAIWQRADEDDFEKLVEKLMRNQYPASCAKVNLTAGPAEEGCDVQIILYSPDVEKTIPIGQILIQVKKYQNTIWPNVLAQLEQAAAAYAKSDTPVLHLMLVTTAEKGSDDYKDKQEELEKKLQSQFRAPYLRITTMFKEDLIEMISQSLLDFPEWLSESGLSGEVSRK